MPRAKRLKPADFGRPPRGKLTGRSETHRLGVALLGRRCTSVANCAAGRVKEARLARAGYLPRAGPRPTPALKPSPERPKACSARTNIFGKEYGALSSFGLKMPAAIS